MPRRIAMALAASCLAGCSFYRTFSAGLQGMATVFAGALQPEPDRAARAPEGDAPFRAARADGRVVALREDGAALVDPAHPYLAAIDARPVEEWIAAAQRLVAPGSPQRVRRRSLEALTHVR